MRHLTAFLIFLFTSQQGAGAQDLQVLVRVLHEGGAVAQAGVTLGAQNTITNRQGEAAFRVAAGRFELRVERVGLETFRDTITVVRDTTITVTLEESALEVEEIIVTSTRGERRVRDEPVKVEVVTREEVEEKLLMTPGSISMLLNETSGLRVQETSPALGGAVIRVQGLRGRYTQLLSDGLPLYGGQAGSLGILQIPPVDLAQVEVIKGAASALYGASALGGAINLISRRPADETELLLNQTTRNGTDAVLWNSQQISERVGYTALVSGHLQQSQDIDDDGWADLPRFRRVVARPRLFLTSETGARLMITGGLMLEDRTGGGAVPTGRYAQELSTGRFDFGVTGRKPINEKLQLDTRAAGSMTQHEHLFGTTRERDAHTTGFAETSLRGHHGKHFWVAGAALQRDAYAGDDVREFDFTYWTPSIFAQDEVAFTEQMIGSFSVRADWHSEYGSFVAPRVSTLFRLTDLTSVRLSAGRGYFGPTPFTEETEEVGLSRVRITQPLRVEVAEILSADVNWSRSPIETNLTVFASRVADAVEAVEQGSELALINVPGDTRTYGVEALARFRQEPFGLTASYTFVHATQPAFGGGRAAAPLVPKHSAGLVAVYEQHGEGRVGLEMYYTGAQTLEDNPYRETSNAYVLMGVLAERRFGRFRAFVNLENLTNVRQTNYDPLLRPVQSAAGRWTTDVWAPVDGRTINGGVRIAVD